MIRMIKKSLHRLYNILGRWYLYPLLKSEYKGSAKRYTNERLIEYSFAFKWLSELYPEKVLDVGSGTTAWPHIIANCGIGVTAIDSIREYWKGSFFNRHYYIINDDITKDFRTIRFNNLYQCS